LTAGGTSSMAPSIVDITNNVGKAAAPMAVNRYGSSLVLLSLNLPLQLDYTVFFATKQKQATYL
jgi:hypothetical protein